MCCVFNLCAVCVDQMQPTAQCSFCVLVIKTLEDLLPKERTEVSDALRTKERTRTDTPPGNTDKLTQRTFLSLCHSLQDALISLLEEICHILPASYRDQCQTVIGKFSKPVLDAILSYATPEAVCTLMGLCNGKGAPRVGRSAFRFFFFFFQEFTLSCLLLRKR